MATTTEMTIMNKSVAIVKNAKACIKAAYGLYNKWNQQSVFVFERIRQLEFLKTKLDKLDEIVETCDELHKKNDNVKYMFKACHLSVMMKVLSTWVFTQNIASKLSLEEVRRFDMFKCEEELAKFFRPLDDNYFDDYDSDDEDEDEVEDDDTTVTVEQQQQQKQQQNKEVVIDLTDDSDNENENDSAAKKRKFEEIDSDEEESGSQVAKKCKFGEIDSCDEGSQVADI